MGSARHHQLVIICAALLANACYTPPPVYVVQGAPEKISVPGPPPEARLEVPTTIPGPNMVWVDGYWHHGETGGSYEWVDGRWEEEREGYAWVEATYVYVNNIWVYRPPFWAPRRWRDPDRAYFARGRRHDHPRWRHGQQRRPRPGQRGGPGKAGRPPTPGEPRRTAGRVAAPPAPPASASGRVSAPPAGPPIKAPPPKITSQAHDADSPEFRQARPAGPHREATLRRRPEYRGEQQGRLVFGDNPEGSGRARSSYMTDSTGAIILTNEPDRVRRSRSQQERLRRRDEAEARRHPPRGPRPPVRAEAEPPAHRPRAHRPPRPRVRAEAEPPAHRPRIHRPQPRIHRPPQPRVHRPPQHRVHRPLQPRVHRPAQPRVHRPVQPRVHRPAQPRVHRPVQPRAVRHVKRPAPRRRGNTTPAPKKRREKPQPRPRRKRREGRDKK